MNSPRRLIAHVVFPLCLILCIRCSPSESEPGKSVGIGGTNVSQTSASGGNSDQNGGATGFSGGRSSSSNQTGSISSNGGSSSNTSSSPVVGIAGASVGGAVGQGLTLYYIRHAEVVANTIPADQITYENSETITDLGERQIDALTTYLSSLGVAPDAILVSPAKRTQKTIEPFLVASNLTGEIWMDLYECCQQTPTGAVLPSTPQYQTYLKAKIEAENLEFRAPNQTQYWLTDTYEQGLFMVMTAKDEILRRFSQTGKTVFVVGHAAAGQIMIGLLRGNDMTLGTSSTDPNAVYLLNTGVMRLTQDPATGLFKLEGRNINKPQTQ